MPFPMKVQPLDGNGLGRIEAAAGKPVGKSRLKRLFERSVLRTSSAEKLAAAGDGKDREEGDTEPNSVCLDRMVLSFIEATNDKPSRCGRSRCTCFNCDGSSDDDLDPPPIAPSGDAAELLKGLVPCASVAERNILADATRIVEKGKVCKGKVDFRRVVAEGLLEAGYDAAVCKSRWEKAAAFPAGEYEYVDVVVMDGEEERRLLVDVDFRSEFEIARSTKAYRAALQSLPPVFVGTGERLQQIVAVVSEAARVSLKKKGLHFPPWRKPEYMRSKWLAPYERSGGGGGGAAAAEVAESNEKEGDGEMDGESEEGSGGGGAASPAVVSPWQPPPVRPKAAAGSGPRVVTGLASVLSEN